MIRVKGKGMNNLTDLIYPHPLPLSTCNYIIYMTDNNEEENTLTDFIPYKMRELIEFYAYQGNEQVAEGLLKALNAYILGEVDIAFEDGWPYVIIEGNEINEDLKEQ